VNVEHKFLKEYLGLERVLAVCGNSIGAAKAYQFAVSYPTYARGIVPIVGNAVTSPQTKLLLQGLLDIIALDSGWHGGNYETNPAMGVALAFRMSGLADFTYGWFAANLKTAEARRQFAQSVRNYWGEQDARDIYYQWRAFGDFSIGDTPGFGGDVNAALLSIKAKVLIVGSKRDQLIGRDDLVDHARIIPGARLVEVDSPAGHAACCGLDPEATKIIDREIAIFLSTLR
jgi:homoserine O-acetyltransferase